MKAQRVEKHYIKKITKGQYIILSILTVIIQRTFIMKLIIL